MKTLRAACWLFLAVLQFILFMLFGAMFASAFFLEGSPSPEVLVAHAGVILVTGVLASLFLMGAARCAWRALG